MTPHNPPTLAEQFASVRTQSDFGYALRDYLDRFREAQDPALLEPEPALLEPFLKDNGVADAYLAAAAAWMCHKMGAAAPRWAWDDRRLLSTPYFAAKTHGLRMILLQESLQSFESGICSCRLTHWIATNAFRRYAQSNMEMGSFDQGPRGERRLLTNCAR